MSYIGNSPGVASQRVTTTLTATAAQTQFTTQSGYILGYVDVYLNGAKLVNGSDFEAITGTDITLFAGAASGDIVELISYVPRGLTDGYTKAEADAKFLDVGGDTASGNLALATASLSGNLTLSGGTANGVGYLNGSKVVVAGSALTFDGTILATPTLNLTNALGVAYGGTGQTTANASLNALLPLQTNNATKYLQTDGTNATWDAVSISTADITGTLPVANGGTNLSSFTANGLVYASSSSALATGSALVFDGTWLTVATTTSRLVLQSTTGTNSSFTKFTNTGGSAFVGLDNSGGGLGAAYALHLYHEGNYPIVFSTNNTEGLRLTSTSLYTANGINVGIGLSGPTAKLHVKGGTTISTLAGWNTLSNTMFELNNPAVRFGIGYDASDIVLLQGFDTTNAARNIGMQVYGGNVGIGTSSPVTPLTINGNDPLITLKNAGTNRWQFGLENTSSNRFVFYDNTAAAYRLIINSSGNLGIGTSLPSAKLQVGDTSDTSFAMSNSTSVTSGNRGTMYMYNSADSTVGAIRFGAVTDNVGTDIQFYTRPAAGSLTQTMTLSSAGNLSVTGNITVGGVQSVAAKSFGYGSGYGAVQIGVPGNIAGNVALAVDVSGVAGGAFTGINQVILPSSGTLFVNAAGTNFTGGISRDGNNSVLLGPSLVGGVTSGDVVITTAGNVGIGTDNPNSGTGLRAITLRASDYPVYYLQVGSNNVGAFGAYYDSAYLSAIGSKYISLNTNGIERVNISATGNVGIGTSGDTIRLAMAGTIADSTYPLIKGTVKAPYTGGWNTLAPETTIGGYQLFTYRNENGEVNKSSAIEVYLASNTYGAGITGMRFITGGYNSVNGLEAMRINELGRVGIGSNNPQNKLTVLSGTGLPSNSTQEQAALVIGETGSGRIIGVGTFASGTWIQSSYPGVAGPAYPLILNPSGGAIGIGNSAPVGNLHIGNGSTVGDQDLYLQSDSANRPRLRLWSGTSNKLELSIGGTADINVVSAVDLVFSTSNTEKARITNGGNLSISNGSLIIGTAGNGIDFSADPNAAGATSELLDDYEEGTWTPVVAGTNGGGYHNQVGRYTKVGRVVTCDFFIQGSSQTFSSNSAVYTLTGLPFVPASFSYVGITGSLWSQSFYFNNTESAAVDFVTPTATTSSTIIFKTSATGASSGNVTNNNNGNPILTGQVVYTV